MSGIEIAGLVFGVIPLVVEILKHLYDSKCVYIEKVAPSACWYTPAQSLCRRYEYDTEDERRAAAAKSASRIETPVAFETVGKGRLGFIGDVNQDESTDAIVLSMLGFNCSVDWCTCDGKKFE